MPEIIVAALVGVATISGAAIAARATVRGQVETLTARLQRDNQLLYLWNRHLVDHIYRGLPAPPPAPPPGLFDD